MQCKKCGKEIFDDAKYCPYCGEKVENEVIVEQKNGSTFKEGIVSLFTKLFLFKGRSSRSEFNFGLLFLMIITSVLSSFTITPEILAISSDMSYNDVINDTLNYMATASQSKNILNLYNLYSIVSAILLAIFLCAPVYRRVCDCGYKKSVAVLLVILFVVSQIACSNLLWCLLPDEIYNVLLIFIELLSFINLFILLLCMLKKSKVEIIEEQK